MAGARTFMLLVLALPVSLSRNLEQPRYDTAYACEGKTLKIECKEGELIHLIRANYGRFSITICNDHGNTEWSVNCMSPKSLRVLHNRCSQQQNCSILASTSMFGDPCPGTLKYLEAHYQCMPAATTTTTSRPSPPWLITSQPSVWSTAKSATLRPGPSQKFPSTPASTTSSKYTLHPSQQYGTRVPPLSPQEKVEETLAPLEPITTPLPPSSVEWKTASRTTNAPSTTAVEYVPFPSVPRFQQNDLVQLCSPTTARNLFWNWTSAGEYNVQACPGGTQGSARWRCSKLHSSNSDSPVPPSWIPDSPDLSECRSLWLTSLEARVEEGDSITSIANDLSQVTSSKTLYGGDMMTTTQIIKKMAQKMSIDIQTFPDPRQREAIVTELLYSVVQTSSNLLDSSQHPSWRDLSYMEQMRVATSLLMGLEENAFLLADTVVREKTVDQSVKNILLSVRVVEVHNVDKEHFPSPVQLRDWPVSQDWLYLPRGALLENSEGGLVRLVFIAFNHLEEILQPQLLHNITKILNSKVISASLGKGRHIQLSEPVRLSLRHLITENVSNAACVFWDYTTSSWSEEGCHVESTNLTHTICLCDHLTNFAILMDVHGTHLTPSHQMALQIITYIGCIISVVCLVLAIITFQFFRGLKSDRTTIHKNLCVCLLVAEVLFLVGIGQTDKPIVCGIVAGLLHFFFLCAFAWMFLEGFQLYVMLIEVFEAEKSRIRCYYVIAYGVPLIIVAISCIVDPFSYGTEKYCWLRADNFFIFWFVGPVIAVILANLVFLSMAIYMMCRHTNSSASMKSKEHSRLASARAWLRGAIVLVFLLGLTWTFGLLYLNEESVIMAYIFTVLNSIQGLFIFVFHCVQNEKVRKEYRKFIRRHSWLPKCLRCSKHTNGKERRSSLYAGSNGNPSAPNSHSTDSSALSPHGTSNISFKSYSRDSGHGGSEQEDSPRSHNTTTLNSLNNLRTLNNSKDARRQPYMPSNYHQGFTNNLSTTLQCGQTNDECVTEYCRDRQEEEGTMQQIQPVHHQGHLGINQSHVQTGKLIKKSNSNLRSTSPWNHTYTEIREKKPSNHGHSHHHHHHHHLAPPEDDPVYEEIERSEIQVSDMSDEDGKRQSDVSRQSSRSYGDHRPLIPYSPAADRNFPSCLDAAFKPQLKEYSRYHQSLDRDMEVEPRQLSPMGFHSIPDMSRHLPIPSQNSYLYSGENARTIAVLDGETVVCHLQQGSDMYQHDSYNSRTVLPQYREC